MHSNESDLSSVSHFVVVVPAAGIGKRFGGEIAKQYLKVNGKMILDIALNQFLSSACFEKVILVVSPEDDQFRHLESISNDKLIIIDGGEQRQLSVNNALRYLYDNGLPDKTPVLVHDAVRPCLSSSDLEKLIQSFQKDRMACFLAEPVTDSIKRVSLENKVVDNVSRDDLVRAQTPQICTFIELKNAFSKIIKSGIEVTDEVSALIDSDIDVRAVISDHLNFKITHPRDLELAEAILVNQSE